MILGGNSTAGALGGNETDPSAQEAVLAAAEQYERLRRLAESIIDLANAGNLSSIGDIPVLGLDVDLPPLSGSVADFINAANNGTNATNTTLPPVIFEFPSVSSTQSPSYSFTASQAGTQTQPASESQTQSPSPSASASQSGSQVPTPTSSATRTPSQTATTTQTWLPVSTDGSCGAPNFQFRCRSGDCCSRWGFCGTGEPYCGAGCQVRLI